MSVSLSDKATVDNASMANNNVDKNESAKPTGTPAIGGAGLRRSVWLPETVFPV